MQLKGFGIVGLYKPHRIDVTLPSPTWFLYLNFLASSNMAPFGTLPELVGPSVVIKTVKWHFQDFVGLPQAIPCSVVPFVHLYCMSVKGDESVRMKTKTQFSKRLTKKKKDRHYFNPYVCRFRHDFVQYMSDTCKPG